MRSVTAFEVVALVCSPAWVATAQAAPAAGRGATAVTKSLTPVPVGGDSGAKPKTNARGLFPDNDSTLSDTMRKSDATKPVDWIDDGTDARKAKANQFESVFGKGKTKASSTGSNQPDRLDTATPTHSQKGATDSSAEESSRSVADEKSAAQVAKDSLEGEVTAFNEAVAKHEQGQRVTMASGAAAAATNPFAGEGNRYKGRDLGYVEAVRDWPLPKPTRNAGEVYREIEHLVRPSGWRRVLHRNELRNSVVGVLSHPRWGRGEQYGRPEFGYRSLLGDLVYSIDLENSSKRDLKKVLDILISLARSLAEEGRSGGLVLAMARPIADKLGQHKRMVGVARDFMKRYAGKARYRASAFGLWEATATDFDFMLRWSRMAYWAAAPYPELHDELAKKLKKVIRKARGDVRYDAQDYLHRVKVPDTDDPFLLLREIDSLRGEVAKKRDDYTVSTKGGWKAYWAHIRGKEPPKAKPKSLPAQLKGALASVDKNLKKNYRYRATLDLLDAIDIWARLNTGEEDRDLKFATSLLKSKYANLDEELAKLPPDIAKRFEKVGAHNLAEALLERLDVKTEQTGRWGDTGSGAPAQTAGRGDPNFNPAFESPFPNL